MQFNKADLPSLYMTRMHNFLLVFRVSVSWDTSFALKFPSRYVTSTASRHGRMLLDSTEEPCRAAEWLLLLWYKFEIRVRHFEFLSTAYNQPRS